MTIKAIQYIQQLNLEYNYLYKISGRYWLNDNFTLIEIKSNIFKRIDNNPNNIFTALYKIDRETVNKLLYFLLNNIENMKKCIGFEVLIAVFVKNIDKKLIDIIGVSGFVTVCGSEYNG